MLLTIHLRREVPCTFAVEIKKVACIGAGLIGHGWATLFAWKGYTVTLQDLEEDILDQALYQIRRNLEFLAEKGLLKDENCEDSLRRVTR